MKKRTINQTTLYVIIVCVLLLLVNAVLGMVLMNQSGKAMSTLIRRHMVAVADTAAASLDGDKLGALTEADVGSPDFKLIADTLTKIAAAQKDNDIKYIYCAKKDGDHFVFTVDPDPVDPGKYGDEVVYTPAQDAAWEGVSAIDEAPYVDKWGRFYTAWSPVRNAAGDVVGLVGVDFVPDWYVAQEASHRTSVIICSVLSIVVGAVMMLLLTSQTRRRIRTLNGELHVLTDDLEKLSGEIARHPAAEGAAEDDAWEFDASTIGALSDKVHKMQRKLTDYMDYAHRQMYTDSMTGVGNKTAYLDYVGELNKKINAGTASFAVAVFDMNGLKNTNDNYGHECGDRLINDAAISICSVFEGGRVFRIGGDEFIAVLEHADEAELQARFRELDQAVEHFNLCEKQYAMTLSFARGGTAYRPGQDSAFKEVFKRADEHMYRNKEEFYRQHGDRRHPHYEENDML